MSRRKNNTPDSYVDEVEDMEGTNIEEDATYATDFAPEISPAYEPEDAPETAPAPACVETVVIYNHRISGIKLPPLKDGNTLEKAGLTLLPGENNLTIPAFDLYKKTVAWERHLLVGNLEYLRKGTARPILKSLDGVPFAQARELIGKEKSSAQIKDWMDGTKNHILLKFLQSVYDDMKVAVKGENV